MVVSVSARERDLWEWVVCTTELNRRLCSSGFTGMVELFNVIGFKGVHPSCSCPHLHPTRYLLENSLRLCGTGRGRAVCWAYRYLDHNSCLNSPVLMDLLPAFSSLPIENGDEEHRLIVECVAPSSPCQ